MALTFKEQFNKKYGFPKDTPHSLKEISQITGFKLSGLQQIFNKGIGAYKTNPQSVRQGITSAEQWAQARVYASISPNSKSAKIDVNELQPRKGFHLMPDGSIMKGNTHPSSGY